MSRIRSSMIASAVVASIAWGSAARAQQQQTTTQPAPQSGGQQQTTVVSPPPPPPQQQTTEVGTQPAPTTHTTSAFVETRRETVRESGYAPNRYLLTSGVIVFGVPYLSSVIVASSSSHAGDGHLAVPLVGPWLDLGDRGPTNGSDAETTNKVLLGVDGVFQAIGAIEIISALLMPETKEVMTVPETALTPKMQWTPAKIGAHGYGLTALATF